jgi:hypothetical protein
MSNPTSNFNWQMPTNTDLVSQLPADFEVFGQAVDTSLADLKGGTTDQVLAKNSNTDMDFKWVTDATGMTNPMTTTGDIIYSSSGSTPARLGIGTTGQVVGISAGVPAWTTPGGTGGYTLLNAGGTALSGNAAVTVSGITSNDLLVYVTGAATTGTNVSMDYRFNSSTTNHYAAGLRIIGASAYAASNFDQAQSINGGLIPMSYTSSTASRPSRGFLMVQACKSTAIKPLWFAGANDGGAGTGQWSYSGGGYYDEAAAITSVSLRLGSGNFSAGTLFVYGRN